MGAKASTANGESRSRTFSTGSNSDVVPGTATTGFNLLRVIPGMQVSNSDRQRARSLSSVPNLEGNHNTTDNLSISPDGSNTAGYVEENATANFNNSNDNNLLSVTSSTSVGTIALGRVYTATSLPSHIWSLNGYSGIKCPVCSKFILPDDIEYHLVMCLTKPRLSYNEDILTDAKGECVICLEDLNPGDVIARLPCLCIYHKGCIDKWFEVNRCCPEHPGD